MPGCVLRVRSRTTNVDALVRASAFKPVAIHRQGHARVPGARVLSRTSGFNVEVSRADGNLAKQTRDAVRFLRRHAGGFRRLRRHPGFRGMVLDFGLYDEASEQRPWPSYRLSAQLVGLAGHLGLEIMLSFYGPTHTDRLTSPPPLTATGSPFHLRHREFRRLSRRARAAQQANQFEVVGLLAVDPSQPRLLRLASLRNRAEQPGRWELWRGDISERCRQLKAIGLRTIGLFHSHPASPAKLGPRDQQSTPNGWYHLVYDVCARDPRLYRVRRRRGRCTIQELPLLLERSARGTPANDDK